MHSVQREVQMVVGEKYEIGLQVELSRDNGRSS